MECYKINQGSKGTRKQKREGFGKIPINEILNGEHPQYQTFKLKNRLIEEGLIINKCSSCSIIEWNGNPLNMELDHIDGCRTNHKIENLRLLCPNCHAQTGTYRSKNKVLNREIRESDM